MSRELDDLNGALRILDALDTQRRRIHEEVWQLLGRATPEIRSLILRMGLDEQGAAHWACCRNPALGNASPAYRLLSGQGHEVIALVLRVSQGINLAPRRVGHTAPATANRSAADPKCHAAPSRALPRHQHGRACRFNGRA